jgi:CheY-like chemotaxis protein
MGGGFMQELDYQAMNGLIVDDFESFRGTLTQILKGFGIGNIDTVNTGEEAIAHIKARAYDLILCDYNLGRGKTGLQVLEELRFRGLLNGKSLFVLISAESSKHIIMAAYDYEPDAYLTKPITAQTLAQRLTRLFMQMEELSLVHKALNDGDKRAAIAQCKILLAEDSRYSNNCQKILGQLYLDTQDISAAEALYRSVLECRDLEWAQLGMAMAKMAQGDLLSAQQWLEPILQLNPLCLKAYDLQAKIYQLQGEFDAQQDLLKKALDISPLSLVRLQEFASVAQANDDLPTAAHAYQRALKLGEYSCFDRADCHLQFARTLIDLDGFDKSLVKPMLPEAFKSMAELELRFGRAAERKAMGLLLTSQLHCCRSELAKSNAVLQQAKGIILGLSGDQALALKIELVKALRLQGKLEDAETLVGELLSNKNYGETELEQLDVLLEEPRSEKNKIMLVKMNKKAIDLYNNKNFSGAVAVFHSALQKLPGHSGLYLNYTQALIDQFKVVGDVRIGQKIQQSLASVERLINTDDEQFPRYQQLHQEYQRLMNGTVQKIGGNNVANSGG